MITVIICTNFEGKGEHFAVHVVHLLNQGYLFNSLLGLHVSDVDKKISLTRGYSPKPSTCKPAMHVNTEVS